MNKYDKFTFYLAHRYAIISNFIVKLMDHFNYFTFKTGSKNFPTESFDILEPQNKNLRGDNADQWRIHTEIYRVLPVQNAEESKWVHYRNIRDFQDNRIDHIGEAHLYGFLRRNIKQNTIELRSNINSNHKIEWYPDDELENTDLGYMILYPHEAENSLRDAKLNLINQLAKLNSINREWFMRKMTNDEEAIANQTQAENNLANHANSLSHMVSMNNIPGIYRANKALQKCNDNMAFWLDFCKKNKIAINNFAPTKFSTLKADDLTNISNTLAGEAGEEIVEQAVHLDNTVCLHNVMLSYGYGQNNVSDNQIDNLFITSTGVYSIEVKTRNILENSFDASSLEPAIENQISFHKSAIVKLIRQSKNPVLQEIRSKADQVVKNIIVVINRKNQDFNIINSNNINDLGAKIIKASQLNLCLTNSFGTPVYLNLAQIKGLKDEIEQRELTKDQRRYQHIIFSEKNNFPQRLEYMQPYIDNAILRVINVSNRIKRDETYPLSPNLILTKLNYSVIDSSHWFNEVKEVCKSDQRYSEQFAYIRYLMKMCEKVSQFEITLTYLHNSYDFQLDDKLAAEYDKWFSPTFKEAERRFVKYGFPPKDEWVEKRVIAPFFKKWKFDKVGLDHMINLDLDYYMKIEDLNRQFNVGDSRLYW